MAIGAVPHLLKRYSAPAKRLKLEKQLAGCLLEDLSGTERYYAAERLIRAKADLAIWGELNPDDEDPSNSPVLDPGDIFAVRQWELDELQEEFEMAKDDLKLESATRAEVVQLGLAVRRLALGFEDEAKEFRARCEETLDELETLRQFAATFRGDWEKKKSAIDKKSSEAFREISKLRDQHDDTVKTLHQKYAKLRALTQKHYRTHEEKIDEAHSEVISLAENIAALVEKCSAQAEQMATTQDKVDQLRDHFESEVQEIHTISDNLEQQINDTIEESSSAREELEARWTNHEQQTSNQFDSLEQQFRDLRGECDDLHKIQASFKEDVLSWRDDHQADVKAQRRATREKLDTHAGHIEELRASCDELRSSRESIVRSLRDTDVELRERLETSVEKWSSALDKLETRHADQRRAITSRLDDQVERFDDLVRKHDELRELQSTLKKELTALQEQQETEHGALRQFTETKFETHFAEVEKLETRCAKVEESQQELSDDVSSLAHEQEHTRRDLISQIEKNDEIVTELNEKYETLRESTGSLSDEFSNAVEEQQEQQSRLEDMLDSRLDEQHEEMKKLQTELSKARRILHGTVAGTTVLLLIVLTLPFIL